MRLAANHRALVAPVVVAVVVRVLWIVGTAHRPSVSIFADPGIYEALAERAQHGFFLGGPGYPFGGTKPT